MFETWFPRHWTTLKKLIWLRATALGNAIKTVTGAIVTFVTSKAAPLINLTATLSPIQDLHGYPSPWPAGGGKNLLPDTFPSNVIAAQVSGNTIASANNSRLFSIPCEQNTNYVLSNATRVAWSVSLASKVGEVGDTVEYKGAMTNRDAFSINSGSSTWLIITFPNVADFEAHETTYKCQIEKGASATSFAPYRNICPISGHTGVTVYRTGVNVWDGETREDGYFDQLGNWSSGFYVSSKNPITVKPNTTYYLYSGNSSAPVYLTYWKTAVPSGISASSEIIERTGSVTNALFTTPNNCYAIHFNCGGAYGTTYNHDISINYPSTDTDYHAYTGNTYPITFPDGQTVYSGTLQVNEDGTGSVTLNQKSVDLGTLNWVLAYGRFYAPLSDIKSPPLGTHTIDMLCSSYPTITPDAWYAKTLGITSLLEGYIGAGNVGLVDQSYEDASTLKTALSGVQLVYELATPVTIPLTAEQVGQIMTLKGNNVMWVDDSDNISVTYYE